MVLLVKSMYMLFCQSPSWTHVSILDDILELMENEKDSDMQENKYVAINKISGNMSKQ